MILQNFQDLLFMRPLLLTNEFHFRPKIHNILRCIPYTSILLYRLGHTKYGMCTFNVILIVTQKLLSDPPVQLSQYHAGFFRTTKYMTMPMTITPAPIAIRRLAVKFLRTGLST